jgi:hypothetical protein
MQQISKIVGAGVHDNTCRHQEPANMMQFPAILAAIPEDIGLNEVRRIQDPSQIGSYDLDICVDVDLQQLAQPGNDSPLPAVLQSRGIEF